MSTKSVKKNYIYNLLYQFLTLCMPLITTPYISRVLGAENIGIYSYTISISALFILFGSLGVALYGQREIAYYQDDKNKRTITFWEILIFRFIVMSFSMLIFYITFVFIKNDYNIFYKILMIEIFANIVDISWFFMGIEEFKKTVIRNMLVKIVSVICIFIFVKTKDDLNLYFWIYVLSVLIGNLSLWLYLPKYINKINLKNVKIFKHFKPTITLFIPQIAIQIYTILDKTMIGTIIADKAEVGYYDQTQKIIKMLLTIITSLGTVMLPRIAANFAKGEKEKITNYMNKSFNMVFILAFPLIFGIIAVSDVFTPVFFGKGYEKVPLLINVISPIILFIGLSNVTGTQYLLPTKRQKEYTISVICGSVVNLILNTSLIWKFGALGASIGTVFAEITVTAIQIFFTRKDFNWLEIVKLSYKYIIASLVMFAVCKIIGKFVTGDFNSLLIQIGIGASIYFILLLLMKDDLLYENIKKVKGRFCKKG